MKVYDDKGRARPSAAPRTDYTADDYPDPGPPEPIRKATPEELARAKRASEKWRQQQEARAEESRRLQRESEEESQQKRCKPTPKGSAPRTTQQVDWFGDEPADTSFEEWWNEGEAAPVTTCVTALSEADELTHRCDELSRANSATLERINRAESSIRRSRW